MAAPSFKDLEVIEKLAPKLCVPFFAVASVLQPPGVTLPKLLISASAWVVTRPFGLPGDSATAAVLVTAACWGLAWAVACSLFLWLVWGLRIAAIGHSWAEWTRPVLLPSTGFAFLSMGALALCKIPALQALAVRDPLPSLNVFWEVGFVSYGLWCLQLANSSSAST